MLVYSDMGGRRSASEKMQSDVRRAATARHTPLRTRRSQSSASIHQVRQRGGEHERERGGVNRGWEVKGRRHRKEGVLQHEGKTGEKGAERSREGRTGEEGGGGGRSVFRQCCRTCDEFV